MATSADVKDYYDEFSAYEVKQGVNLRHYHVFNQIVASGLRKHHHVLEIGCGIGQITGLLNNYLTGGKIVATDISPASIALAKKRMNNNCVEFVVTDMSDFTRDDKFDFIVLPDVLEHIPIEQHKDLFQRLAQRMHPHSKLVIHIPHPECIDYDRANRPHKLQIIDQALPAEHIVSTASQHGMILEAYNPYCLYHSSPDYVWITFKHEKSPIFEPLPKYLIILKKQWARLKYMVSKI